ncbi:ABC transporter substrate-binding protein [Tessaracoccus lapidicaptus]|uniref:ABC transporter substrate-binding protein n=1 Tax=Tessaracoccus lapidicaptus TaxID=1427523 RepID=A0A1C0AQU9_9ACTN|nr:MULTISPECIES: thiamine ABC transporter substrate-binding protein [Tessaracoccus]AQX16355.1 thiamine ABC transporter substrate-binding protein [Tessaracoccus sp. T2.5-30]OCL36794.1 ABC transporter substrate-binding protein [Tessaracoccus lapidicaptus]VEP40977.1 Thiamine-binding periplasmic protein [Tessaracoccus lapidicaptus]
MDRPVRTLAAVAAALALAACGSGTPAASPSPDGSSAPTETDTLTVFTHDAFTLPEELTERFADETGYEVTYTTPGDAGALVNQLILTKDSPLADVVVGIDNTFSSRAADEGVLSPYVSPAAAEVPAEFQAPDLTPVDYGDVCINADTTWFAEQGIPVPATLDDLTKPEYRDLLVVTNPASSSPGLAFLIATVGAKGDGWLDYWAQLKDNGVKVAAGWTEAYYTDFSGGGGEGPRPLVLSYATSPAFTVEGDESSTTALLDTCFRQVEYAGVVAGAENEVGARKFIDFLLSPEVQAAAPENLYMFPVLPGTALPEVWARFAVLPEEPIEVPQERIGAERDEWIRAWTDAMS